MEFTTEIIGLKDETHDVRTFRLKRPDNLDFHAGQYCLVSILDDPKFEGESHPFTFSSSSSVKDHFDLTIKQMGEFTTAMFSLKVGDKVGINGPKDSKLAFEKTKKKIVFIAGGSGITPFMSAIRYVVDESLDNEIILLYSNRTKGDIIFKEELDSLDKIKVVNTLTDEDWDGQKGRIDAEMIKKYVVDVEEYLFYICGPPPMVDAMVKILNELDISEENIRKEDWQIPGKSG